MTVEIEEFPTVLSIDAKLSRIERDIMNMQTKMADTEEMVRKIVAEASPILAELIPMLNSLMENPMFRMLTKGKK